MKVKPTVTKLQISQVQPKFELIILMNDSKELKEALEVTINQNAFIRLFLKHYLSERYDIAFNVMYWK